MITHIQLVTELIPTFDAGKLNPDGDHWITVKGKHILVDKDNHIRPSAKGITDPKKYEAAASNAHKHTAKASRTIEHYEAAQAHRNAAKHVTKASKEHKAHQSHAQQHTDAGIKAQIDDLVTKARHNNTPVDKKALTEQAITMMHRYNNKHGYGEHSTKYDEPKSEPKPEPKVESEKQKVKAMHNDKVALAEQETIKAFAEGTQASHLRAAAMHNDLADAANGKDGAAHHNHSAKRDLHIMKADQIHKQNSAPKAEMTEAQRKRQNFWENQ